MQQITIELTQLLKLSDQLSSRPLSEDIIKPTSPDGKKLSHRGSLVSLEPRLVPYRQSVEAHEHRPPLKQHFSDAFHEVSVIFDSINCRWLKLANSIDSDTMPATNNTVERVIRRFNQHNLSFYGFESIHHAQSYLTVFKQIYRFSAFSPDTTPEIAANASL